jgi:hypothetical protein
LSRRESRTKPIQLHRSAFPSRPSPCHADLSAKASAAAEAWAKAGLRFKPSQNPHDSPFFRLFAGKICLQPPSLQNSAKRLLSRQSLGGGGWTAALLCRFSRRSGKSHQPGILLRGNCVPSATIILVCPLNSVPHSSDHH